MTPPQCFQGEATRQEVQRLINTAQDAKLSRPSIDRLVSVLKDDIQKKDGFLACLLHKKDGKEINNIFSGIKRLGVSEEEINSIFASLPLEAGKGRLRLLIKSQKGGYFGAEGSKCKSIWYAFWEIPFPRRVQGKEFRSLCFYPSTSQKQIDELLAKVRDNDYHLIEFTVIEPNRDKKACEVRAPSDPLWVKDIEVIF